MGRRLRAARQKAGLSQRQLAFPGCSPAYISRIESGDRIPSLQLLRELGRRLGVTEDWLATGSVDGRGDPGSAFLEAEVALRLDDLDHAERRYAELLEHAASEPLRARAQEGLGQVAYRRGNPRLAVERFEAALALYGTPAADHPQLAESMGRSFAMVGEPESAVALFERSLERAERDDDALGRIRFMVLLGDVLVDSGDVVRAEGLLGRALAIGKDAHAPGARARLYWTQSRRHAERNEPEPAARYARRALEVLRLTEDALHTARARQLLAHLELDRGRSEEALQILEEGVPLLESNANPVEWARYRLEEARSLAKLGRREEAGALAMQIAGILADAHPEDAARSYTTLAEIYQELGDRARALELFELSSSLQRPNNPNRDLAALDVRMADLHEAVGRPEKVSKPAV